MGRSNGLTAKQEAFCQHYNILRNARQAALKAGYTPLSAKDMGKQNLKLPAIQARMAELRQLTDSVIQSITVAATQERYKLLSQIARHQVEMPVSAGHVTGAIAEMNKMDGSYAPEKHAVAADVRILVVFEERRN